MLIVLVISAAVVLWAVAAYNGLVRLRNLVREAWSGIDVQLKRRHNLVPALIESVRGYSAHERALFDDVVRARSRCMEKERVGERAPAENALSGMIRRLFAVAEAYPDLKASRSYLDLQKNLSQVEDDIQLARRYYNGTVRDYNIRVESFPSMLVARLCGFGREDFFEIEYVTEREVPDVRFGRGRGT